MAVKVHRLIESSAMGWIRILCDPKIRYHQDRLLTDVLDDSVVTCKRCLRVIAKHEDELKKRSSVLHDIEASQAIERIRFKANLPGCTLPKADVLAVCDELTEARKKIKKLENLLASDLIEDGRLGVKIENMEQVMAQMAKALESLVPSNWKSTFPADAGRLEMKKRHYARTVLEDYRKLMEKK